LHTNREVRANRPVIQVLIKNEEEETSTLIDVAIPADRNITQKRQTRLKYKSLCMEIQRMWNMLYTILSIIIGATGMAI
jgi:hypothetical protein